MPTILIYDPADERRRVIRETLGIRSEWELAEVESSAAAIEQLHERPIDVVLIDLPSFDVQSDPVLEWLRDHDSQTPVILLTANADVDQTSVKSLLLGVASYVPRSVIARDLVVTIDRLLTLAGCRRRHAKLLHALDETESNFTLADNDLEMVPVLVGHLIDTCTEFEICSNGSRMRTAVAIEEAITNGIIHGNLEIPSELREHDDGRYYQMIQRRREENPYQGRELTVTGSFTAEAATITIRDEGNGFNTNRIPDPTDLHNLDKSHGRGLFLIRAFMDEVEFNAEGNEIRLVKCAKARSSPQEEAANV